MLSKSKKWIAALIALLMIVSLAVFAACGGKDEPEDEKTDVPPTVVEPETPDEPAEDEGDPWANVDWANYSWGAIKYQLQTYCIGHSEWGLVNLYEDGSVQVYGRMVQNIGDYFPDLAAEGPIYSITRTYLYGYWYTETDRDDITTMYINYKYILDYDSGTGQEYEKTFYAVEDINGEFSFNNVVIPCYLPEYGMLYDTCSTDTDWTYFLEAPFIDVNDMDATDAFFDGLDAARNGEGGGDSGDSGVTPAPEEKDVIVTFTASKALSEGDVYAYLYSDYTANIYNDYFASTCTWTYEDGVLLLINDNGTDTYEVTIDGNTASFDYSYMGIMNYTFVCDDITPLIDFCTNETVVIEGYVEGSETVYYAYLYADGSALLNDGYIFTSDAVWWYDGTEFAIYNAKLGDDLSAKTPEYSSIEDGILTFTFVNFLGTTFTYTTEVSNIPINTIAKV